MKTIKLTDEQIKLLIEILNNAETEANFAQSKRYVNALPGVFNFFTNRQKDLASIRKSLTICLNEKISDV